MSSCGKSSPRVLPFILSVSIILLGQVSTSNGNVYWACESHTECNSVVPTTYCNDYGYCECPPGRVFSPDISECLTESLHGEPCQEGVQCSHMLTGAVCSSNQCTCRDGLTYLQGRCRTLAPLFADCETEVDCAFGYDRESVICKENKCQCANGFYQRSENICRRILYDVGEVCTINADCQGLGPGHRCNNFKCALAAATEQDPPTEEEELQEKQLQQRTLGVQTSIDVPPSKSTIGVNTSIDIPDTERDEADEEDSKFGDDCTQIGQSCPGLAHSECRRNKCYCRPGYYPRNGACFAELGEVADSAALCATVYRDGKCVCTYDQFYQPNMRTCLKTIAQINNICTQESQCTPFGDAYCTPASPRRCVCRDYTVYDEAQQLCVKRVGLRQFCEKEEDCAEVPNTTCYAPTNSCVCKAAYYEENEKCRPGIGAQCNLNSECGVPNSECVEQSGEGASGSSRGRRASESTFTKVLVDEDPLRSNNIVRETIHEELEIDEHDGDDEDTNLIGGGELAGRRRRLRKQSTVRIVPTVKSSSSSSSQSSVISKILSPTGQLQQQLQKENEDEIKICKCKESHVAHNQDECLEKAKRYGDACENTEQCTPLLGNLAECDASGQCVCKDEAHFNYNKCNKKVMLGDTCARVSDCFVEENKSEVQCRNAKCQCGFDSVMDTEQRKCVKVAAKNSSSRPSPLKVITLLLIAAAVFVTTAAIKDAVLRSQGH